MSQLQTDLWAYFLLHSLDFLAPGGRLAMLVPEAILQADYAAPLRETLAERFGRTSLIYIRDRLFDGTDEPVVVVACADFGGQGHVTEEAIECVEDLEAVLADAIGRGRLPSSAVRGQWAGAEALELLSGIEGRRRVSRLSEFATVRGALRDDWFRVELPPTPDAFATCTRLGSPLLVLNCGSCHCSNTIHRVQWKADLPVAAEAVAVGFLTSAVGLWAELHGRRYGGGVLKIEPGTLNRIPVPLVPGAEDVFPELDGLLREGAEEKARDLADEREGLENRRGRSPVIGVRNHQGVWPDSVHASRCETDGDRIELYLVGQSPDSLVRIHQNSPHHPFCPPLRSNCGGQTRI